MQILIYSILTKLARMLPSVLRRCEGGTTFHVAIQHFFVRRLPTRKPMQISYHAVQLVHAARLARNTPLFGSSKCVVGSCVSDLLEPWGTTE